MGGIGGGLEDDRRTGGLEEDWRRIGEGSEEDCLRICSIDIRGLEVEWRIGGGLQEDWRRTRGELEQC